MIKEDLIALYNNKKLLIEKTAAIRNKNGQKKIELCSINNTKSGNCSEDCSFCSQSIKHKTDIKKYDVLDFDSVLDHAKKMESFGVKKFSLVTSGKNLTDEDLVKLIPIYRKLNEETNLSICASHGLLDFKKAEILYECGVSTYHHNLESNKKFFKNICTSHKYENRVNTIKNAKKAGLEICSGGIIGLGETLSDRIDLARELNSLGVKSIPINVLIPMKGTALENFKLMDSSEIFSTLAIMKFINPDAIVRLAGGRSLLNDKLYSALDVSCSGLMLGDYLTSPGSSISDDLAMLSEKGFVF